MGATVVLLRSKSPAGIEPRLSREAKALVRAGYEVHAILWDRQRAHPTKEDRDGVRIHRYQRRAPEGRRELVLHMPGWWCHSLRRLLRLRPDVVHAVDLDTFVPALFATRLLGSRLVYEIFDFYADMVTADLPSGLRARLASLERRAIARADLVIIPDRRREAQFHGARPRRLVEILNVPEETAITPSQSHDFVVFYGGMIARDRGLRDLVVAIESTGAKLLVAGHGPDEAEILPILEASPASMYLGTIPHGEVLERTAAAQLIPVLYDPAVPNNRLAAPNKLYEAMMFGKPVIANEGTAAADVVREVGCGVVVPYGDRAALTRALEDIMLSPARAAEMGGRGRTAFETRFNWMAMTRRLLEAYAELTPPELRAQARR